MSTSMWNLNGPGILSIDPLARAIRYMPNMLWSSDNVLLAYRGTFEVRENQERDSVITVASCLVLFGFEYPGIRPLAQSPHDGRGHDNEASRPCG